MSLYKGSNLIAGSGISQDILTDMKDQINALLFTLGLDAPDFSETATYNVGDIVSYKYYLWKCTVEVSTAGPWTGETNWTKMRLIETV